MAKDYFTKEVDGFMEPSRDRALKNEKFRASMEKRTSDGVAFLQVEYDTLRDMGIQLCSVVGSTYGTSGHNGAKKAYEMWQTKAKSLVTRLGYGPEMANLLVDRSAPEFLTNGGFKELAEKAKDQRTIAKQLLTNTAATAATATTAAQVAEAETETTTGDGTAATAEAEAEDGAGVAAAALDDSTSVSIVREMWPTARKRAGTTQPTPTPIPTPTTEVVEVGVSLRGNNNAAFPRRREQTLQSLRRAQPGPGPGTTETNKDRRFAREVFGGLRMGRDGQEADHSPI